MSAVSLIINGEPRSTREGISLLGLLAELELDPAAVVVELNREIVRRPELDDRPVRDGDQIELVHFVGGG
jgi:thiamine biosynthesis protein ThiS